MENNNHPLQKGFDLGEGEVTPPTPALARPDETNSCILPVWDDNGKSIILPNCFVRSGLFGISKSSGNILLKRKKIPCAAGIDIVYTGPVLVQSDFDVWYGLLSLSKAQCDRHVVNFGTKPLLSMLGRSTGKSDREWLKGVIAKLSATTIEVSFGDVTYGGSLIDEFVRDETTGRYAVRLNKKLANLFAPNAWSAIDFQVRSKLRHKPLAQWLHAFYSTHRTPLEYGVEKIMCICGSESMELYAFRQCLREALDAVATVTGWKCVINKESDTVAVRKLQEIAEGDDEKGLSDAFKAFWESYHPRKRINFIQTQSVWKTMALDGEAFEIMEGLERWKKSQDWSINEGQWVPSPDKFLEKGRWKDHPAPYKVSLVTDRSGRAITHDHGNVERDYGKIGTF